MILTLRLLLATLRDLNAQRKEWWRCPAKCAQRRAWEEAVETAKLTELQRVNNRCEAAVKEMKGRVGGVARWRFGVSEGGGVSAEDPIVV